MRAAHPLRFLGLVVLALALPALAQEAGSPLDARITILPGEAPAIDAAGGLVALNDSQPGARYAFDLALPDGHTTIEIRASGLALDRPRQLVPSFVVPETEYPLFAEFPHERVWDVDAPANVAHANGTGDDVVLRLGLAGPRNVTLALDVDRTPPTYTIGPVENLTHFSFYQEARTDELALANLQVRKLGATEWIDNPTPVYHFRQRFPVQGLDADTDHEAQIVFTDWAGNSATSPAYTVRSAPAPDLPLPRITPLSPEPNSTIQPGAITVRARVESNESPVAPGGVRVFFDKREVTPDVDFDGTEVRYTPTALAEGRHSVGVEVTNDAGGTGIATWSFSAGTNAQPMPGTLAAIGLAGAALLARAMRRRR